LSSSEIKKKSLNTGGAMNDVINFRDEANLDNQNLKIYKKNDKSTSSGSVKNINC
jgi:hypothetical protein